MFELTRSGFEHLALDAPSAADWTAKAATRLCLDASFTLPRLGHLAPV